MSVCPGKLLIYNRSDDFLKLEKKEKLLFFLGKAGENPQAKQSGCGQ